LDYVCFKDEAWFTVECGAVFSMRGHGTPVVIPLSFGYTLNAERYWELMT
jgi:hypothetical protein